ncbi:MAG: hypothetical protein U0840_10400 [Gemmataceae bacterium]
MSQPSPLTSRERADLIAYLDGELSGEAARAVEARISLDPHYRAEAESFKRTWEMLDFLPRKEPSPSFTERTLSRIDSAPRPAAPPPLPVPTPRRVWPWQRLALGGAWVAALLLAGWLGYRGYYLCAAREPGERELVRDLRIIENLRFYELVEDLEFLRQLDHPDLFGEASD